MLGKTVVLTVLHRRSTFELPENARLNASLKLSNRPKRDGSEIDLERSIVPHLP